MVEPNRLRNQVAPSSNPAWMSSTAAAPTPQGVGWHWTARRALAAAMLAELFVLGAVGAALAFVLPAEAVWLWLLGHFVAGLVLGLVVLGTSRGVRAISAGVLLGAAIAGVLLGSAAALGILPPELAPIAESGFGTIAVAPLITVAILGLPVELLGVLVASIPVTFRRNRRRRSIARGERPLLTATGPLQKRTDVSGTLDDVALVAAVADGAATRVVLTYRGNNLEQLLAQDRLRLAAMGYALVGEDRRGPRTGFGWTLFRVVGVFVGLLALVASRLIVADVDPFGAIVDGRITATFELRSPTHEPLSMPGPAIQPREG